MLLDLDPVTKVIQSPPAQLAAGVVLFGIVWGFFKGVESVLADDTKFEIAVWLVGVEAGKTVEPWPETFAKVFDRVFGTKHLSWKCFGRSALASLCIVAVLLVWIHLTDKSVIAVATSNDWRLLVPFALAFCVLPDYVSLLKTRLLLSYIQRHRRPLATWLLLLLDCYLTAVFAVGILTAGILALIGASSAFLFPDTTSEFGTKLLNGLHELSNVLNREFLGDILLLRPMTDRSVERAMPLFLYPVFFTSIWLWLYAGSGFLLKVARRFDIGFRWFNKKFDIEKKPLSAIGLVAGAIVAIIYWGFALGAHLLK